MDADIVYGPHDRNRYDLFYPMLCEESKLPNEYQQRTKHEPIDTSRLTAWKGGDERPEFIRQSEYQ